MERKLSKKLTNFSTFVQNFFTSLAILLATLRVRCSSSWCRQNTLLLVETLWKLHHHNHNFKNYKLKAITSITAFLLRGAFPFWCLECCWSELVWLEEIAQGGGHQLQKHPHLYSAKALRFHVELASAHSHCNFLGLTKLPFPFLLKILPNSSSPSADGWRLSRSSACHLS